MPMITAWRAARSGAALTLTGRAEDGHVVKITEVLAIEAGLPWPVARDARGVEHQLVSDEGDLQPATAEDATANQMAA